jgi:hypothetical protein
MHLRVRTAGGGEIPRQTLEWKIRTLKFDKLASENADAAALTDWQLPIDWHPPKT